MRSFSFLIAVLLIFLLSPAQRTQAQQGTAPLNPEREKPLEITADETLEWHRNTKQYIARGNAIAKQGNVAIKAETLSADYHETAASSFEIYRLTASENVEILSRGSAAYGDKAIYEVDRGLAVMTGDNLKLTSPDQSVTAEDSFEYWVQDGKLTAKGDTQVVRGENQMRADTLTAYFEENNQGKRTLKRLEADGNVVITTPDEVLRGKSGVYDAASNIARLTGDVTITRGPNVLEGKTATVNLATNVSKIEGGTNENGRVRGIFYPGSENLDIGSEPAN